MALTTHPSELLVCTTCRPADAPRDAPAAGQALLDLLTALCPAEAPLRLRGFACLGACGRACTAALQAPGKMSQVLADLTPDAVTAQAVLSVALQHAGSADGALPWPQRPERLRRALLVRLPVPQLTAAVLPVAAASPAADPAPGPVPCSR